MTAPIRPAPASLYHAENWIFIPSGGIASAALIPTAAEVNAGSALDLTNMLFADTGMPTQSTNRVTQERRLGDATLYEAIGAGTVAGGDLHYAYDPQAAAGSNGKKAFEKFTATGTSGFFVQRLGVDNATTPVATQFVNVYPVSIGASFPARAGDGETAQAGMTASYAVTAPAAIGVALT